MHVPRSACDGATQVAWRGAAGAPRAEPCWQREKFGLLDAARVCSSPRTPHRRPAAPDDLRWRCTCVPSPRAAGARARERRGGRALVASSTHALWIVDGGCGRDRRPRPRGCAPFTAAGSDTALHAPLSRYASQTPSHFPNPDPVGARSALHAESHHAVESIHDSVESILRIMN